MAGEGPVYVGMPQGPPLREADLASQVLALRKKWGALSSGGRQGCPAVAAQRHFVTPHEEESGAWDPRRRTLLSVVGPVVLQLFWVVVPRLLA